VNRLEQEISEYLDLGQKIDHVNFRRALQELYR
jgi:hypothetical protein